MQMVDDVINLLDHLGIEKANIVGYSMGGIITQNLVINYPDRVLKAVSGGAGWSREETGESMLELAESLEAGNGIAPLLIRLTPIGEEPPSAEEIAATNEFFTATNDALALAAVARGFQDLVISADRLAANEIPILYVVGDLDPLKLMVGEAIGVIGNARAVTIPGVNHTTAIPHPLLADSIRSFLIGSGPTKY